ncbi:alpha-D-ribose 1-methylphosphonate 5-triphosphate synthase subunit PhnL [Desulfomicrobium macestii]|uniref:Alpha-D-ribose 1-methylphosphonate 5-triphosphate synthase subunit PhnL n=2 Tax=Desulfomicrobium TaxID=898 RepID=A0A8G2FFF3_DESNO|nr:MULTISPECIES: phosphonate C-P lyase system protein PhnL [Desulfomicrobium]MBE1425026.1 alpha-D-ribose 1-methylphosphonate 5-triphosphate synthase subunit PhnL [Desulfomicrobium macestii]SFM03541.1 alpha-D-ribose 1-methylphosphonate 5-triphosphate synthase subunit PhnL [Desulfomicrobium norvegicum]
MNIPMISIRSLAKTFVLHTQGGTCIRAFDGVDLDVAAGECIALHGPSGSGKSSLLRSIYANYRPSAGSVVISHDGDGVDMTSAQPRTILDVRRRSLGYVSQFLRVIPRVSSLDLVAERLTAMGVDLREARERAGELLARLNIPERLWSLAPATFSGGEQQRVNIARGFIRDYPILLLDEPTASLDGNNRNTVVDMILEAKARGAAIVGIFHDDDVRERVADRCLLLNRPE